MNRRSGLSFVDVLIILAIALLLAALAIPRFIQVPDYGNEEDTDVDTVTNTTADAASTNAADSGPSAPAL
jgi:Tfp pilus assembly protein FimT